MSDYLRLFHPSSHYRFRPRLRNRLRVHHLIFIAVISLLILAVGCRTKPTTILAPKPNAEALKYLAEGDVYFGSLHLYGWRQAEALYQKAYELSGSDESGRKLLLTRFLIMTRQIDEDIPYSKADEVLKALCAEDAYQKALCEITERYLKANEAETRESRNNSLKGLDNTRPFNGENPEMEAYLNLLWSKANQLKDQLPEGETLAARFKDSPLFLYLNLGKPGARNAAELENAFPQFAEAFEYTAESLFLKKKYGTARAYFQKAIDLIPDYTRAITGLGNIYFYALEDYGRALDYYESVLKWDPTNIAALFGKGAVLHHLGKYEESNATLDRLLASDISHNTHLGNLGILYYQGETPYLKAYNHHLMKNSAKARELVDLAKQFLPDSEEINYLSGVLFYESNDLESARKDFLHVIQRGNANCNAQFHLGLIYFRMYQTNRGGSVLPDPPVEEHKEGSKESLKQWLPAEEPLEKKAPDYFLGASSCMQSAIRNQRETIDSVPSLDLRPDEKVVLKGRLESRLMDMRIASSSMMETMIKALSEEEIIDKEIYLNLIKEILTHIRAQ